MTIEPDWKAMYDISNRRAYALEHALRAYMQAFPVPYPHQYHPGLRVSQSYQILSELEADAIKAIRGEE